MSSAAVYTYVLRVFWPY